MRIHFATEESQSSLIALLVEINAYYNPQAPASEDLVREHTLTRLLAPDAAHQLVLASDDDGRVTGLAAIALVFSLVEPEPYRCGQCQLKELFVSDRYRGCGIGHALMAWVAQYALSRGCQRIDWSVKASNARGIAFYLSLGANPVEDRLSFRLAGPAVARLAAQAGDATGVA